MEDIDPDRSRAEYADAIIRDLRWLGLDWDEGPDAGGPAGPYVQSARMELYADALNRLGRARAYLPLLLYPQGASHVGGCAPCGGRRGRLPRNLPQPAPRTPRRAGSRRTPPCIRLRCPSQNYAFEDAVFGPFSMTLEACGGDFALRRSDGVIAYQLAVVVDDGLMGITQVVRGRIYSSPRRASSPCSISSAIPAPPICTAPALRSRRRTPRQAPRKPHVGLPAGRGRLSRRRSRLPRLEGRADRRARPRPSP